ncbi:hypothetical protein [Pseudomonas gingeri]|uniref:Uncharacterized protein n=1 Tax=Pseudomonas gingeri TaxID=117681 RepID=A0A7Y7YID2_9PSED|nr:hypothetical protein [Pseudomonas gingeri]NWA03619.1 hypothetical protein [Pseudomonas gingeri]NWA14477.1 hypothetical protein [Pseudomonas gingeri]NWA54905.1 hypothetical protein [Pseudomonas gingeri]NWA94629.1 hypothetical protein [Pseudomonas gingeri]NWB01285.1 hypothetical protein [Pseudomonas gingeri]
MADPTKLTLTADTTDAQVTYLIADDKDQLTMLTLPPGGQATHPTEPDSSGWRAYAIVTSNKTKVSILTPGLSPTSANATLLCSAVADEATYRLTQVTQGDDAKAGDANPPQDN